MWGGGRGQGGPNLLPLIPCNPGFCPFFLGFLPFALFRLQNFMQCCIIPPISPTSCPFRTPTSCPFLSRLPYPTCPLFSCPLTPPPPPHTQGINKILIHVFLVGLKTEMNYVFYRVYFNLEQVFFFGGGGRGRGIRIWLQLHFPIILKCKYTPPPMEAASCCLLLLQNS